MDRYIDDVIDMKQLPLLAAEKVCLQFVKVNQLSAERMHKIGSVESKRATNIPAVAVSGGFRRVMLDGKFHGCELSEMANALELVHSPAKAMEIFSLHRILAHQEQVWKFAESTGVYKKCMASHTVLREIVYRNDLVSMFNPQEHVREALDGQIAELA